MRLAVVEALRRDVARIVGDANAVADDAVRERYGRDASAQHLRSAKDASSQLLPDVVAWPGTTDEVTRLVQYARAHHVALTPRGGGTGTMGGAVPMRAGVVVDMKRMHRVLAVSTTERWVRAQAGICGRRLEQRLRRDGLALAHVPEVPDASTLGGWFARRDAGALAAREGTIGEQLLGLTAVAGTGELLEPGHQRRPGPDFRALLCGSEGTLAVFTDLRISVRATPAAVGTRSFRFRTLEQAGEAMRRLVAEGEPPSSLRLENGRDVWALAASAATSGPELIPAHARQVAARLALTLPAAVRRVVELTPGRPVLHLLHEGDSSLTVERHLQRATAVAASCEGEVDAVAGERVGLLTRRHRLLRDMPGVACDVVDLAATWSDLVRVEAAVRGAVGDEAVVQTEIVHPRREGATLLVGLLRGRWGDADALDPLRRRVLDTAAVAGAGLAGHLGLGSQRVDAAGVHWGDAGLRLQRALKAAFDPDHILNPGKVLR
jgi:alkyldihydroxyacetonephosphate synthase